MTRRTLSLAASALLLLAGVGRAQPPAAGWKLDRSETLPAAVGLTHTVQSLSRAGSAPSVFSAEARLHFVSFDAARHTFAVFDQGDLGRANLGEALTGHHALAGSNGGYFLGGFEPDGLLLAGGKLISHPVHARLLSGALVATPDHLELRRSTQPLPGKHARDAVQAGPFLVEFGLPVPGLNAVRSARRTAVFTDGGRAWGLVSSSPLTLEELGAILATPALLPAGLKIDKSLNLDGGHSTALWVDQPGQAPFSIPETAIVRDFVGIVPRPAAGTK